ncbi:MAG: hypothetical protein RBS82_04500 [Syntrophales bacterium]|nr:hypothetical protein [Syntrophales bacterium]
MGWFFSIRAVPDREDSGCPVSVAIIEVKENRLEPQLIELAIK